MNRKSIREALPLVRDRPHPKFGFARASLTGSRATHGRPAAGIYGRDNGRAKLKTGPDRRRGRLIHCNQTNRWPRMRYAHVGLAEGQIAQGAHIPSGHVPEFAAMWTNEPRLSGKPWGRS